MLFNIVIMIMSIVVAVVESTVIYTKYPNLCGQNTSLSEPNIVLKIDFNVDEQLVNNNDNCTTIIQWTGSPDIRLIPKIIQTNNIMLNQTANDNDSKTIVLDIIETPGRIFQLNIYGSKAFYLAMIPTNGM